MPEHGRTGPDAGAEGPRDPDSLRTGSHVAVRTRFDGTWAEGFEIIDSGDEGQRTFQVRRRYDDAVLPARFDPTEVRRAR